MVDLVRCRDECGRSISADQVQGSGWQYLEIQRTYRCTACWRALGAAADMEGSTEGVVASLPPHSIGALTKETASTILPPAVKG